MSDPGHVTGGSNECLPFRAVHSNVAAMQDLGGDMGGFVDQNFLAQRSEVALEIRMKADEAKLGVGTPERSAQSRGKFDAGVRKRSAGPYG
jgi:hypothetical protein